MCHFGTCIFPSSVYTYSISVNDISPFQLCNYFNSFLSMWYFLLHCCARYSSWNSIIILHLVYTTFVHSLFKKCFFLISQQFMSFPNKTVLLVFLLILYLSILFLYSTFSYFSFLTLHLLYCISFWARIFLIFHSELYIYLILLPYMLFQLLFFLKHILILFHFCTQYFPYFLFLKTAYCSYIISLFNFPH